MIIYERNLWESGERYLFRSSNGATPICQVVRTRDGWDVLFFRGPANLGPYHYLSFERAKAHLLSYLRPREEALRGDPARWVAPGNLGHLIPPASTQGLATHHPRRARRRGTRL